MSYFLRELISHISQVLEWNSELLHIGGILCRAVYEWELSNIQQSWEQSCGTVDSPSSSEFRNQLNQRFLHILQFFTFHHSTPSPKVARLIADSFYRCSSLPLTLLSSIGTRRASDIRKFDAAFTFLKSLPMLSEHVTRNGATAIASLPDGHKICSVEPSDVQRSLHEHTLDEEELVACLRWWIVTLQQKNPIWTTDNLLHSATLSCVDGRKLPLSSVQYFIDPKGLGAHIPPNGPLPGSLLPLNICQHFSRTDLASIHWQEFTVTHWLQYLSDPSVVLAPEYDFRVSRDWAEQVLTTLFRLWPSLSHEARSESREVLKTKPCIPTTHGLCRPDSSYLLAANDNPFHNLELANVQFSSGSQTSQEMEILEFIGVRRHVPPEVLRDR